MLLGNIEIKKKSSTLFMESISANSYKSVIPELSGDAEYLSPS